MAKSISLEERKRNLHSDRCETGMSDDLPIKPHTTSFSSSLHGKVSYGNFTEPDASSRLGRFIFVVVNNKLKPNLFPVDFVNLFFNLLL